MVRCVLFVAFVAVKFCIGQTLSLPSHQATVSASCVAKRPCGFGPQQVAFFNQDPLVAGWYHSIGASLPSLTPGGGTGLLSTAFCSYDSIRNEILVVGNLDYKNFHVQTGPNWCELARANFTVDFELPPQVIQPYHALAVDYRASLMLFQQYITPWQPGTGEGSLSVDGRVVPIAIEPGEMGSSVAMINGRKDFNLTPGTLGQVSHYSLSMHAEMRHTYLDSLGDMWGIYLFRATITPATSFQPIPLEVSAQPVGAPGPGSGPVLSLSPEATGEDLGLTMSGGPSGATGFLVIGPLAANPATVAPGLVVHLDLNASEICSVVLGGSASSSPGTFSASYATAGVLPPSSVAVQGAVLDPAAPFGVSVSNALAVSFQ